MSELLLEKNNARLGLEQVWIIDEKLKAKKSGSNRVINIYSIDSLTLVYMGYFDYLVYIGGGGVLTLAFDFRQS